jgi:hypothetical protein
MKILPGFLDLSLNIVKMTVVPKLIYTFNAVLFNYQGQNSFEEKNKVKRCTLPDFKTFIK